MEWPDLPQLEGTPKQIAWADAIPQKIITAMQVHRRQLQDIFDEFPPAADVLRAFERERQLFQQVLEHASAAWWIDRRAETIESLAAEAAREELA